MPEKETTFSISSKIEAIDDAVTRAMEFVVDAGFGEESLFGIDMAVREAVANAVKHGNKLDDTKSVEIGLADDGAKLLITVRDFGEGFAVEDVPDPTNPENLLRASGRGILFMHNFVDTVEFENLAGGGMLVKMTKNH